MEMMRGRSMSMSMETTTPRKVRKRVWPLKLRNKRTSLLSSDLYFVHHYFRVRGPNKVKHQDLFFRWVLDLARQACWDLEAKLVNMKKRRSAEGVAGILTQNWRFSMFLQRQLMSLGEMYVYYMTRIQHAWHWCEIFWHDRIFKVWLCTYRVL